MREAAKRTTVRLSDQEINWLVLGLVGVVEGGMIEDEEVDAAERLSQKLLRARARVRR